MRELSRKRVFREFPMFGQKKGSAPQTSIDSLIGVGTRIEGDVFFSGGLRVGAGLPKKPMQPSRSRLAAVFRDFDGTTNYLRR